jgi:hypothetical protein
MFTSHIEQMNVAPGGSKANTAQPRSKGVAAFSAGALGVRITCIGRKTLHCNHSNARDEFGLLARKYQTDRSRPSYFITRWNREFGSISVAIGFYQAKKLLMTLRTIEGKQDLVCRQFGIAD